jgi:hypothetical protein
VSDFVGFCRILFAFYSIVKEPGHSGPGFMVQPECFDNGRCE